MVLLDRVNLSLVELLQKNGRISLSELARRVRRAETTVRERLAALEAGGLVKGYTATIDSEKLGYQVRAFIHAEAPLANLQSVSERLAAIPHVLNATLTSGPRPLIIELVAKDMNHLSRILEQRISPLGLLSTDVHVSLKRLVEHRPAPALLPSVVMANDESGNTEIRLGTDDGTDTDPGSSRIPPL